MKEIITGKTGNGGMFVYMSERETRPQLARRWFNYGFNDYVSGKCAGSAIDYKIQLEREKADDERGQWVKKWAEYGYRCAILYFEVLGGEGTYNAFRHNPAFLELLDLDYKHEPPLEIDPHDIHDGLYNGFATIRDKQANGRYGLVACHKFSDPNEDMADIYLSQRKLSDVAEFVNIYYPMV